MKMVPEYTKNELMNRYGEKLKRYVDFAMESVFHSKKQIKFEFFPSGIYKISKVTSYLPINDNEKAYATKDKIHISDWAMEQDKDALMHIVIHEICHVLHPEYSEDEVIIETDRRFNKLSNSMHWKIF